jgi:hypothetical protein
MQILRWLWAKVKSEPLGATSLFISVVGLMASIVAAWIAYKALWYQFIRETHKVSGHVVTSWADQRRVSAEIVFSNDGNQTEVITGGNFIYCETNVVNWQTYTSLGTNSIPITVLKPGDKVHIAFSEPFFSVVRTPFRFGAVVKTIAKGFPIHVQSTLGDVTKAGSGSQRSGDTIIVDRMYLTVNEEGFLYRRPITVIIPLIDY